VLCVLLLAVCFLNRAIRAIRSASGHCSRGPNHPFLDCPSSPACSTNLWVCIERGPIVSDLGYVGIWWCVQRTVWRDVSPVVLLARQGQNQIFLFHFLLSDSGEDEAGGAWRRPCRRRVQGEWSHRLWRALLEKGRLPPPVLLPFSSPCCPNLPPRPLLQTLAAVDFL
jgi:hypothetical protein